ncbi:MAG: MCP four helix bundle domain-containing protein [Deltaproteobacteria bacterium]|nr:MCP four helix bundle domain-containing protein [Deltaproteobacteria bacterium]
MNRHPAILSSLRARILLIVIVLTLVTMGAGLASLWYVIQTDTFFKSIVDHHLAMVKNVDRLEYTLLMQKDNLSSFFPDSDQVWLKELDRRHGEFNDFLTQIRRLTDTPDTEELIKNIEQVYSRLSVRRGQVFELYQAGKKEEARELHQAVQRDYADIHGLIKKIRWVNNQRITEARKEMDQRADDMIRLAVGTMVTVAILSALLAFVLVRQVLIPIRRLILLTSSNSGGEVTDEVQALNTGLNHLLEDMSQAKSELEASRMRLEQAAKMASVGKLAASVAHSIRNPLTSVKMRLFSLERSLVLSQTQREDLTVISDEIRHIDNVLRNFLEFSRRPKLKVQKISPSAVVDMALDLVGPRMQSYDIELLLERSGYLPDIDADPDQLKEALVNLLVNASEAVGRRGRIQLEERIDCLPNSGRNLVIRVRDNGPGVPLALKDQIFQPFFSTKDEGTGLGLSIAERIVAEHGGSLDFEMLISGGAAFTIRLPMKEVASWKKS